MSQDLRARIRAFLESGPFAVVGASSDRQKFGNRVLRRYQTHGLPVVAVHPKATEVEGLPCYPELAAIPERPRAVSIVTPPAVTESVVQQAIGLGIEHLWMQPGAESAAAVEAAAGAGISVIAGGPCVLVELG